jgi:hypothetical protein
MSLDSTQIATAGGAASAGLSLLNPALGLAAAGATSFFTAQEAADEQEEFAARNIQLATEIQRANEQRQRRTNAAVRGRFQGRIAASGFTTRGTPIEQAANLVAAQQENILIERFKVRASIQDMQIRSEYAAAQTRAQGTAGLFSGLGSAGQAVLSKVQPSSFFEEA